MKSLIEEVARLDSEKEKMESEMTRERTALQGLLEDLKTQHDKVVEEKRDILLIKANQRVAHFNVCTGHMLFL